MTPSPLVGHALHSNRSSILKRIREEAGIGERLRAPGTRSRELRAAASNDDAEDGSSFKVSPLFMCAIAVLSTELVVAESEVPHFRHSNAHQDRPLALDFIRSWDDKMFQMRMERGRSNSRGRLGRGQASGC